MTGAVAKVSAYSFKKQKSNEEKLFWRLILSIIVEKKIKKISTRIAKFLSI